MPKKKQFEAGVGKVGGGLCGRALKSKIYKSSMLESHSQRLRSSPNENCSTLVRSTSGLFLCTLSAYLAAESCWTSPVRRERVGEQAQSSRGGRDTVWPSNKGKGKGIYKKMATGRWKKNQLGNSSDKWRVSRRTLALVKELRQACPGSLTKAVLNSQCLVKSSCWRPSVSVNKTRF